MAGSKQHTHKHLNMRGLNPYSYNSVVVDEVTSTTTFLLHNLSGQLVGYQEYRYRNDSKQPQVREDMWYYTYKAKNHIAVWGLEKLNPSDPNLIVVEGTFKAVALHRLGWNAIALLTSTPDRSTLSWLRTLPYHLIGVGDNDAAGMKLVNKIGKGITSPDLDELSAAELNSLFQYLRK